MDIKKKILIADDDDFILSLVATALQETELYEVTQVKNGREALEVQAEKEFDLVITDIIMPEIDGIKFIDELKKMNREMPVIAMSGGASGDNVDQYIDFASYFANETLTKPFTKKDLVSAVAMVIRNKDPEIFSLFY